MESFYYEVNFTFSENSIQLSSVTTKGDKQWELRKKL